MTNSTVRGLWLAVVVLTGLLIALAAGLLGWAGGMNLPMAILTAGSAFAGAVLLGMAMIQFSAGPKS